MNKGNGAMGGHGGISDTEDRIILSGRRTPRSVSPITRRGGLSYPIISLRAHQRSCCLHSNDLGPGGERSASRRPPKDLTSRGTLSVAYKVFGAQSVFCLTQLKDHAGECRATTT